MFNSKSNAINVLDDRPPPPLPEIHLSEEVVNEVAAIIRSRVNALFSVSLDIALGKDSNLFFKVAGVLLLISVISSWMDFLTLGYTSNFSVLIFHLMNS